MLLHFLSHFLVPLIYSQKKSLNFWLLELSKYGQLLSWNIHKEFCCGIGKNMVFCIGKMSKGFGYGMGKICKNLGKNGEISKSKMRLGKNERF